MWLIVTSTIRTFFLAVIVTGLIACGDSSSSTAVDSPDATGPFGVGHSSFNVVDPARDDRPLLVGAWYPVDAADAQESPRTEYPLADPLTLPSVVAVEEIPATKRAIQPARLARAPAERTPSRRCHWRGRRGWTTPTSSGRRIHT
jgi:hypothetical protein